MKKTIAVTALIMSLCPMQSALCRDYFEDAGNVLEIAMPVAALGVSAYKKDLTGAIQLAEAFAATVIVTEGLKYAVREKRPDGGTYSFPSGHTSATFCAASYLDVRYGDPWSFPAYALAALTGWSRIESNNHYPWDVAAGALIGVASNLVFTRQHINKVKLVPVSGNGNYGVGIVYLW